MSEPSPAIDRPAAMRRVERVRAAYGLGKGAFAGTLGMMPQNYSACLGGKMFLTVDQLYALWRRYGADPDYVLGGSVVAMPAGLLARLEEAPAEGVEA